MNIVYNMASSIDGDTLKLSINGDIGGMTSNNSEALANILSQNPTAKNIELELNSSGGSLLQGISMFNQLESHPANVTTIVTGVAASATSIIFMAGDRRIVKRGGFVMIHKPMVVGMNNAQEMREKADQLDKYQDAIVDIYEAKTSLSRDEINSLVDSETWLNADESFEKGFATEKTEDRAEVKNKIDYCEFVNTCTGDIPEEAKKYFKNQNKYKIQQVLNKIKETFSINPTENGDDMNKEEVQAMLAEEIGKREVEFSNKLDDVKNTFTNQLAEKDELINTLNSKIVDLENNAKTSTIENIVDGFIAEGKISPANRDFEIENLKLREGKDSFETYKNSIAGRESVVDFTVDIATNGVQRQSTKNLDDEIEKILNEAGLTTESANQEQYINAAKKAGVK